MRRQFIAAIDQGTTSTRCIVFDREARIVSMAQREHRQLFPVPGWVEHDPEEIWANVQQVVSEALERGSASASQIAAIGVTNQRETTVVWDRATGKPVCNAIVWQDTRTEAIIRATRSAYGDAWFRDRTGLPLATYFAGPKVAWILDSNPELRRKAEGGDLAFGTIDSWLIWKLTGGSQHVTDVTNASRTLLMNLETAAWDHEAGDRLGVPPAMLPSIRPSVAVYGEATGQLTGIPVGAALGDQQAALFGQACFSPGDCKSTYGTGAFVLLNTGSNVLRSRHGLLTTVAYAVEGAPVVYAVEGSIGVAGALVQWFRDELGLIDTAAEVEALAMAVPDNGGCYIVPAFSGLYAPHWRSDARGVIAGLTRFVGKGNLARAALEAVAWQTRDVVDAMVSDCGLRLSELKVDGGMTANSLLMQILADVLDVRVVRPRIAETTCLGAAYAAGLAVGYWRDFDALRTKWQQDAEWRPTMRAADTREKERRNWQKAVERSLGWVGAE